MNKTDINKISILYEDAKVGSFKIPRPINSDEDAQHHRIMHSHEFYELHFMLEGTYEYSFSQKEILLNTERMGLSTGSQIIQRNR